ncbi:MAG: hypothetical protein ABI405_07795 [Parafilimonas sp.]
MEENLISLVPDFKLYKDRAIYVGTFLGGPLVAGYLAAENFKQLGQYNKVKTTWIIAAVATIIIFGGVLLIPNVEKIPGYIIPLIYTVIAQFLVKHFQGKDINEHIKNGGQTYSVWRAVLIGLLGLVITFAVIFVILLLTNSSLLR